MLNHRMTRMHCFANDLSMAHSLDKMIADISECQLQISNDSIYFPKKKKRYIYFKKHLHNTGKNKTYNLLHTKGNEEHFEWHSKEHHD